MLPLVPVLARLVVLPNLAGVHFSGVSGVEEDFSDEPSVASAIDSLLPPRQLQVHHLALPRNDDNFKTRKPRIQEVVPGPLILYLSFVTRDSSRWKMRTSANRTG